MGNKKKLGIGIAILVIIGIIWMFNGSNDEKKISYATSAVQRGTISNSITKNDSHKEKYVLCT